MGTETPPRGADRTDPRSNRWLHAFIGAVITVVTAFIPFSPAIGGGVAGYLDKGTDRGGLQIGALSGLIASIPLLAIFGLVVSIMLFGTAVSGEVAGPLLVVVLLVVIAMFSIVYIVVLSAVGGFLGATVADSRGRSAAGNEE